MLRAAALELLLRRGSGQAAEQLLLAPAGQALRAFASRRRMQPAWVSSKPKADKEAKLLEARVQRLARELGGQRAAPSAGAAAAAAPAVDAAATDAAAAAAGPSELAGAGPSSSAQPASAEGSGAERPAGGTGEAASSSGSGDASSSGGSSSGGGDAGAAAEARAASSTSSWMPSFLKGLLPGSLTGGKPGPPRRASPLMSAAASAPSAEGRDLAAAAAAAAAAQEAAMEQRTKAQEAFVKKMAKEGDSVKDDPWENIVMLRDMTLDEYLHQVRSWKGEDPPRPAAPQRHGIDARRIEYLRWGQHEIIVQSMTENEKALVRFDPAAAVANRALLSALAARSGYSLAEVRDAVTCYRDMRDRINCLIEYRESGRAMPNLEDMESKTQAIEVIRAQRRKGDLDAVLARRDRANCPVKPFVRMLGRRVECPNTRLPYMHCCGAAAEDTAAASKASAGAVA